MPDLTLSTLSYGGDCLGRLPDGRVVFIPFGIPGERVSIEVVEENRKYARGKLVHILEPSPLRVDPQCPHFGTCGGCHYQHIAYDAQLKFKANILSEQLNRVGKLAQIPTPTIIPSQGQYQYRNNIRFHVLADGHLGFLAPHSNRVISINECHLPEASIAECWPLLSMGPDSGIREIEFRCGSSEEVLVTMESEVDQAPEFETETDLSAVFASPGGRTILAGEDIIRLQVKDKDFRVAGDAFFQVNTPQAGAMVDILLENMDLDQNTTVMDLYCGVGLFSTFIAPLAREVIGIEISPAACQDFIENLDPFDNVSLYEGPVERVLPSISTRAEAVILDPPRAGLHPKALAALLSMRPRNIAYISCDPATLARDLSLMNSSGYQINRPYLVDLFPQTYHQEAIVFLHLPNG